jgi:hypothetical protein
MKHSKSKTFHEGDDFGKVAEWVMNQFETNDYQPEGTLWLGGEPGPHDPVCELKFKYVVTVTKEFDETKD